IPTALALALLLNRPGLRGRGLYRLAFFAPQVVGLTFGAVLASLAFDKRTGLVNQALHALTEAFDACLPGRQPPWNLDFPWLQEHALAALVLASVWLYAGFHMLFFLAALQNVSPELREAAVLDGAGAVLRFRHVTLPAIRPVAGFLVLLAVIGGLQLFELPYIMLQSAWAGTGGGGRGVTAPGTTTISGARAPALPPAVLRRRGRTGRPPAGSGRVRRRAADAAAHLALLLLASVTLAPVAWMVAAAFKHRG